jgi:hypothetical protein
MHGIRGIPYIFASEPMDTTPCEEPLHHEEAEEEHKIQKPKAKRRQCPNRKIWSANEKKLFNQCFTMILPEVKNDPKQIRPKMLLQKLKAEYNLDLNRTQVGSYLQKYRLKKFGNKKD